MDKLLGIIARLRGPSGCPWDRVQTHDSLKPYLLEESYEMLEALDGNDDRALVDEMGDVLLQLLLHAQLKAEKKRFTFNDVVARLTEKMIFRHPHVFGERRIRGLNALHRQWDQLKLQEKGQRGQKSKSVFDGIPKRFSALMSSQKIQSRVAKDGFDWPNARGPLNKVKEELRELSRETGKARRSRQRIRQELGDLLFSVVNLCRKLDVCAELALLECNRRFQSRYLRLLRQQGGLPTSPRLRERAWKTAKRKTRP